MLFRDLSDGCMFVLTQGDQSPLLIKRRGRLEPEVYELVWEKCRTSSVQELHQGPPRDIDPDALVQMVDLRRYHDAFNRSKS